MNRETKKVVFYYTGWRKRVILLRMFLLIAVGAWVFRMGFVAIQRTMPVWEVVLFFLLSAGLFFLAICTAYIALWPIITVCLDGLRGPFFTLLYWRDVQCAEYMSARGPQGPYRFIRFELKETGKIMCLGFSRKMRYWDFYFDAWRWGSIMDKDTESRLLKEINRYVLVANLPE